MMDRRIPVLYVAPFVDIGGTDKGTIDWFRFLDRDRFRPSLITTQPSPNRRLAEIASYADELWELPQLMRGDDFPRFILAFVQSRAIRLVHIMNSRLGFELLPDIAALADRPRVVVQLHSEEPGGGGHFQYVTTRYGNLVDAFSVSSQMLGRRLGAYGVPTGKRRVIPTGVDAEREFCPGAVEPIDGLDRGRFQILFPARLAPEKDPLLMLEVASGAREAGLDFQIQVVGDGGLSTELREQIASRGLEREVVMNGASVEVARWYAACDAVLLTSQWEGLPYVAYEAMAMAMAVVAPAFPGIAELLTPETGILVADRGDVQSYVDALEALAGDPARRAQMGELARARVRAEHSLERMCGEHMALYDELLGDRRVPADEPSRSANGSTRRSPPGPAFRDRRPGASPLVSVVVPCLNHGHYLPDCLNSITCQTYEPIETIVVDDGSSDPETLSVLSGLEDEQTVIVVRLPENRGAGAARNAGIERATGRYVLPLDADDLLMRNAIRDLVDQLGNAGEQVGFVYPNVQFFGNRSDHVEAPSYNLHALLDENYCATASLFDREVFDRGFRYPEDVVLGIEDWDFVLSLAEAGIRGQPAQTDTLLCRKFGFNRSDLVRTSLNFDGVVAARHPRLFSARAQIKGEWDPSLTVVALDSIADPSGDTISGIAAAAATQTCSDFELIVRTTSELGPTELGGRLRRFPTEPGRSRAQALSQALATARGRYVLAAYGSPSALLTDRTLIEKVIRVMHSNGDMVAVALADAGAGCAPFALLGYEAATAASLGAVCWTTIGRGAPSPLMALPGSRPLEALARMIVAQVPVQWRCLAPADSWSSPAREDDQDAQLGEPRRIRAGDLRFPKADATFPACPPGYTGALGSQTPWRPPQTRVLYRHLHPASGRYLYTNSESPPSECVLDSVLGALRAVPLPGTVSLLDAAGERVLAIGELSDDDPALLGFVEQAPLPLLDELRLARHLGTSQEVLVAGSADPLAKDVDKGTGIGYIEPYPIHPRLLPQLDLGLGLVGLVRTVDREARRHRYGAGNPPAGVAAGELGALFAAPAFDTSPLWIDDHGNVFATGQALTNGRPSVRRAIRWTGAPLTWSDFAGWGPKLRASGRRAYDSTRLLTSARTNGAHPADPAGYLLRSATRRSVPLYVAVHPVTGDQLLSNTPAEPISLGYHHVALLGYLVAEAPVTGRLGAIRVAVPWASRFGVAAVGA